MKDEKDCYGSIISSHLEKYNNVHGSEYDKYYKMLMNSIYGKYKKTPEKTDEEKLKEERVRKLNEIL
jgi:hypothetical protein